MSAAEHQAANVVPPRRGKIIALAVDATARPYDLRALDLAGYIGGDKPDSRHVYLDLQAVGGDVWLQFSPDTQNDLNPAAALAAGSPLAYDNTHGSRIPQNAERSVRIDRSVDKWLTVRTSSGAATLILSASSESF